VLSQIDFPIQVASDLKLMDERLFRPEPMFLGLEQ
jgi:acyl CoA:acetate/3-ketoacid CoA transferase